MRTSSPPTAAITSCPTPPSPLLLPPGAVRLGRTLTSDQFDVGRGLIKTDRNNISPRVGFAHRLDNSNKTVLRGGFGIFHPTGAAQGARNIMSRNPFRYTITNTRPRLQQGFSSGTQTESLGFGNQGLQLDLELPDIYRVQSDARARAAVGPRRARQLSRVDDEEAAGPPRLQHRAGERRATRQRRDEYRRPCAAAVSDLRHVHGHHRQQRAKDSSTRCSSSCSAA